MTNSFDQSRTTNFTTDVGLIFILTARRYDSAVYAVIVYLFVSVGLSATRNG